MNYLSALIFIGLITSCSHTAKLGAPLNNSPANVKEPTLADGTYEISICDGRCDSNPAAVKGILVIDRTRNSFSHTSEAMRFLMRSDSTKLIPNYCYYFDPATSNSKDTLFKYDIVSFGEISASGLETVKLKFMISSPDFRFISDIESADATSFKGNWYSSYAGNGGMTSTDNAIHLYGNRISGANAEICFDATRRYRHDSLKASCTDFAASSCEQGDK